MTQTKKAFKDWDISDFDFANADGKTTFQFRTPSGGSG